MGQRTFMRHTLSMKSKAMACRAIGTFPILVTRRAHGSSMMLTSQPLRSSSASTTKHGRRCCTALSHRNLFTSTAMMGIPPFSRGTGAYYSRPRYHQHCSLGSVSCKLPRWKWRAGGRTGVHADVRNSDDVKGELFGPSYEGLQQTCSLKSCSLTTQAIGRSQMTSWQCQKSMRSG